MAITIDDFSKIWASASPLTPYSFSASQYKEGWNFIGSTPPSRQMWDFLQKNNDEKSQYLLNNFDNYLPLSGGSITGDVDITGDLSVSGDLDVTNVEITGDLSVKGKMLSLVELEKRLEALPTTDKVNALIKQAITDLLNSGDVAVNGTQTKIVSDNQISNYSQWNNFTYTAKESGWYSVCCSQPKNGTSSAFIWTGNNNKISRVNGNGTRDISPGPIWVKAGETISYGCIYYGECILQATTREA